MNKREGYLLAEMPEGGLMLETASGTIFELNESSATIWKHWLANETETEIARLLTSRYALSFDDASRDVRAALNTSRGPVPAQPATDFSYERTGDRYVFRFCGTVAFLVEKHGEQLTIPDPGGPENLRYLLQAVAPKIMALRGQTVLHASAVALNHGVLAVAGKSGAGKTTTARALSQAGGRLVSEDKLLVISRDSGTYVSSTGEQVIAKWVRSAAEELAASGRASCAGLDEAASGEFWPLREIGFVDAGTRGPGPHGGRLLRPPAAAGAIFRNAFYGSDDDRDWARHLSAAAAIANTTDNYELALPDGLESLADVARRLIGAGTFRS